MKVVVIEPLGIRREKFDNYATEILKDVKIEYYSERAKNNNELIDRGKDADVIIVANQKIDEEVLTAWKNLKYISVAFTGVDHLPMNICNKNKILVSNSSGYSNAAVADLVFGMAISLLRNIKQCNEQTRKHGTKEGLIGSELEGKTFGVVGIGQIGMRVAKIANAFGCNVIAYSRTRKENDSFIEYVDLDTLLKRADIISLHVPLNEQTKNLINKNNIKLMKKSSIIINTARGSIVNSQDLADALNNNIIAGAGIDVFETEPPIDTTHPLINAKNTILTPHIGFATTEALEKRAVIALTNVAKWIEGTPQNIIN